LIFEIAPMNPTTPAVAPPVRAWLRLEGLAVVILSAILYANTGASWWLFAALWLAPDLSMLGYLAGSRFGSYCYNAVHTHISPIALAAIALILVRPALLPFALIWFNHIGIDRLCGYGLKYPTSFGRTHLSPPRQPSPGSAPTPEPTNPAPQP
jgi:hypothetical protein